MDFGKENGKVYFVKNGIYGEDIDIGKCIVENRGNISYIENKVVKRKSPYIIKDDNIIEKISKYLYLNIDSVAYLEYDIEKKLKKDFVISSFRKIGKVKEEELDFKIISELEVLGDGKNRYNYRNKVSLKVKVGKDKENNEIAIFRILQKEK